MFLPMLLSRIKRGKIDLATLGVVAIQQTSSVKAKVGDDGLEAPHRDIIFAALDSSKPSGIV